MFVFDFNNALDGVHEISVSPNGWNGPITIEYCVAQAHQYDPMVSVVWRVKGTTHCFTMYEQRMNVLSHGKYSEHFKKALEGFREDYLSWFEDEFYEECQWKYEYQREFGRFIKPKEKSDNKGKDKQN